MTYEQLCLELKAIGLTVPVPPGKPSDTKSKKKNRYDGISGVPYGGINLIDPGKDAYSYYGKNSEPWDYVPALVNRWITGGTTGGSCWDDGERDNHYSRSGEPEPDWDDLTKILEHLCPEISYLRVKALMKLATLHDWTENEYYGNSTTYAIRILKIKDLYHFLQEKEIGQMEARRICHCGHCPASTGGECEEVAS